MSRLSWTVEDLQKAVATSASYRQVIAKLKLRPTGGNYTHIKQYILKLKLNTEHFKGRAWNKGMKNLGKPRIPLEKILVKDSSFQSYKLKKRLFKENLKPEYCEICGWAEKTEDGYLPLELDHINGDRRDNRMKNLRILCPNCHSLQPTHRSRPRERMVI